MPSLILVGQLGKVYGVDGALELIELTDNPNRFRAGSDFLALPRQFNPDDLAYPAPRSDMFRSVTCERIVAKGSDQNRRLIYLAKITNRDQARQLAGHNLFIAADQLAELDDNEVYPFELPEFELWIDDQPQMVGIVRNIEKLPTYWVIYDEQEKFPYGIPLIDRFVRRIERNRRRVVLEPAVAELMESGE